MKTQVLFTALLFSLFGAIIAQAQDEKEKLFGNKEAYEVLKKTKVEKLEKEREEFIKEQKTSLTKAIEKINETVKIGTRTEEQGESEKTNLANQYAEVLNAYNKVIDAKIDYASYQLTLDETKNTFSIEFSNKEDKPRRFNRTESNPRISFAYNFMSGDNLDINDFSYANNNYFAVGHQWKTILDKNKSNFRLLYGIEYQSHGTELNGNRFFTQGNETQIADIGFNADKAKFRQDQLVFPLSIEIGGSKKKDYEDGRVRFEDSDKWKAGIGGFVGFNMSSRLKLKYDLDGSDIKETRVNNFDTEKFVYGLDAYIGHGEVHLFGRMNLNNVFTNNSVDAQYITFGIRLQ